jgi:hypothetical protein
VSIGGASLSDQADRRSNSPSEPRFAASTRRSVRRRRQDATSPALGAPCEGSPVPGCRATAGRSW